MSWIIWGLIALVVAAPFLRERMRKPMDEAARAGAPGEFVELSRGVTHFRWYGGARGPVAVCVHGLTTPSFVWGPIAQGLVLMGFRVLTYDLYGRGYSDRPSGPQDEAFFITQLEELLESQGVKDDFTLLGYSMGGAIATAFAALHPSRLRRLVLLAPGGLGHDLGPIAQMVVNRPWLGTWIFYASYARSYRRATEAERGVETTVENIVDLQQAELDYRGFLPAVLRSMRGILDETQEAEHRDICAEAVPTLAIWGRKDEVIPITGMGRLAEWNREARQEVIEGAGHALAYTHTDDVLKAIRDLMRD